MKRQKFNRALAIAVVLGAYVSITLMWLGGSGSKRAATDGSFRIIYDVGRDGVGFAPILLGAVWLAGLLIGGWAIRDKGTSDRAAALCCLLFWTVIGGWGIGNVFWQHYQCVRSLRSGNYAVVEGPITDFVPKSYTGGGLERITVNGVNFSYSDQYLGQGGFRRTSRLGGPLRAGLYVRIAYHGEKILRIGVRGDAQ